MDLLSKEKLSEKLVSDKKVLVKALIALNSHQTEDEKRAGNTYHRNGVGFRPCHARIAGGMLNFYQKAGFLTDKQTAYWTASFNEKKPRILIYLNQLHFFHTRKYQEVAGAKAK